jgi:hypothetical protein
MAEFHPKFDQKIDKDILRTTFGGSPYKEATIKRIRNVLCGYARFAPLEIPLDFFHLEATEGIAT